MTGQLIVEWLTAAIVIAGIAYVYPRQWRLLREHIKRCNIMNAHNTIARKKSGRETERCTCAQCQAWRTTYKINL